MINKITFAIFFLLTQASFSQVNKVESTTDATIYFSNQVSALPQFTGGNVALDNFLKENFVQPKNSIVNGEVLVSFVVEINGSLSEIGILSDAGFGTGDEAIRVMSTSPSWIPGILNGNKVRVQYLLKIPVNNQP